MNVRVTCDCHICETNAAHVGASFPLAAEISPTMAAGLKVTERKANKASKVHGLVYAAHDVTLRGALQAKCGPWAV